MNILYSRSKLTTQYESFWQEDALFYVQEIAWNENNITELIKKLMEFETVRSYVSYTKQQQVNKLQVWVIIIYSYDGNRINCLKNVPEIVC